MAKKYVVRLTDQERADLTALVTTGRAAAATIRHAHLLLKADVDGPAWTDAAIAEAFGCHVRTVENVRQRCVQEGLEAALRRKQRETPPRERILDGAGEARLIALACGAPPAGRARWTLDLLAERLVELQVVPAISGQTVRRTLKKTSCSPIGASAG